MKADCVKTGPGRNNCTCAVGWVGDGTYCYPSTPCLNQSHCDENALCLPSTPGQVVNSIQCTAHGSIRRSSVSVENHFSCHNYAVTHICYTKTDTSLLIDATFSAFELLTCGTVCPPKPRTKVRGFGGQTGLDKFNKSVSNMFVLNFVWISPCDTETYCMFLCYYVHV